MIGRVRRAVVVTLAVLAVAAAASCSARPPAEPANLDFTLKDISGHDVRLADLKGKPFVINFWATWCGPCQLETPQLEALSKKYRDRGFTILGVETESEVNAIREFATSFKVTYPLLVGLDRTDLQTAYGWTGVLPTSVFVRANGTIAGRVVGPQSDADWERQIKSLF